MSTTEYFIKFLYQFVGYIPMYTFLMACYVLWWQTYRVSWGHNWIGKLTWATLLIFDVLFTLSPDYGKAFRPAVNIALTIWAAYHAYWVYRYPIPLNYHLGLTPDSPGWKPYKPRFRVEEIMFKSVDKRQIWFTPTFRWIGAGVFVLILSAYFIRQLVIQAVESDKKVAAAQTQAAAKIDSVTKAITKNVTMAVEGAVDTFARKQAKANARADTALLKANELNRKVDANTKGLSATNRKLDRSNSRPALLITTPSPKTTLEPGQFTLPEVKPVPVRKGRKVGQLDMPDTTQHEVARRGFIVEY